MGQMQTYSSDLAEKFMSVLNGNNPFAIAKVIHGAGQENDVFWSKLGADL